MFTFFNLPLRCSAPVRAWGQAEVLISNYYLLLLLLLLLLFTIRKSVYLHPPLAKNVIDVLTEMMTRVPSSVYCIVFLLFWLRFA